LRFNRRIRFFFHCNHKKKNRIISQLSTVMTWATAISIVKKFSSWDHEHRIHSTNICLNIELSKQKQKLS
jgi:hypothetical protein